MTIVYLTLMKNPRAKNKIHSRLRINVQISQRVIVKNPNVKLGFFQIKKGADGTLRVCA